MRRFSLLKLSSLWLFTGLLVLNSTNGWSKVKKPVPHPRPTFSVMMTTQGPIGAEIEITGEDFGADQGKSTVTIGGTTATVKRWTKTAIDVTVATGTANGDVVVTIDGVKQDHLGVFTVTDVGPVDPSNGPEGTTVTITDPAGGFGATQAKGDSVKFGATAATIRQWTPKSITVSSPSLAANSGPQPVVVTAQGVSKQAGNFVQGEPQAANQDGESTKWGDEDQNPVGITFLAGYEQGYQSSQEANSYGFIDLYGRRLFLNDRIGPFYGIRLQTAPQASNANGIVSVFTNPTGAITTSSLKSVGSAVDLNVGLDFRMLDLNKGQTSLDLIAGGGFITPVLANTINATFQTPVFGSIECAELRERLTGIGKNQLSQVSFGEATTKYCLQIKTGSSGDPTKDETKITQLIYGTPDRTNYYGKAFAGLRIVNRWYIKGDQSSCDPKNRCERGIVDFTLGQNASITGGQMRHYIFNIDAVHPMPVASFSFIYLFGSISKRISDGSHVLPPLILDPGTAPKGAPAITDLVLPLTQPHRDFYRIGVGISIDQVFTKLKNSK